MDERNEEEKENNSSKLKSGAMKLCFLFNQTTTILQVLESNQVSLAYETSSLSESFPCIINHHNTLALTSYLRWLRWWQLPDGIRTRNQSIQTVMLSSVKALPLSYWQMERVTRFELVYPVWKTSILTN